MWKGQRQMLKGYQLQCLRMSIWVSIWVSKGQSQMSIQSHMSIWMLKGKAEVWTGWMVVVVSVTKLI